MTGKKQILVVVALMTLHFIVFGGFLESLALFGLRLRLRLRLKLGSDSGSDSGKNRASCDDACRGSAYESATDPALRVELLFPCC